MLWLSPLQVDLAWYAIRLCRRLGVVTRSRGNKMAFPREHYQLYLGAPPSRSWNNKETMRPLVLFWPLPIENQKAFAALRNARA